MRLPGAVDRGAARARRLGAGVVRRFSAHGLSDRAAALTYWGFLSLFPALIVLVAAVGVLGTYPDTYRSIISTLREAAPGTVADTIDSALEDALRSRSTSGSLLGVGIVLAFYSASSATGAGLRAVNAIYGVSGEQSWLRGHLDRLGLTLAIGLLLLLAFSAMLVAGPLFTSIAAEAGVAETVSGVISLLRWPIGIGALVAASLLLYRVGALRPVAVRHLLPGACAAAIFWVLASAGFSLYVANFGSYDATYGSLAAVIVLMVWMWISSLALLAGAALNAELEEERGGNPPREGAGP